MRQMKERRGLNNTAHPSSQRSKWFVCLIPTKFIGLALFLISATIILSLIPLYINRSTATPNNLQTSLLTLTYNLPGNLSSNISESILVLRQGNLSTSQIRLLEQILQSILDGNPKSKNVRIEISQAYIKSKNNIRRRRMATGARIFRRPRRLAKGDQVTIYQAQQGSIYPDQLTIFFRLLRSEGLMSSLVSFVQNTIFHQIEFNGSTYFDLFVTESSVTSTSTAAQSTGIVSDSSQPMSQVTTVSTMPTVTSNLSTPFIIPSVKDPQITELNGVRVFGVKDYYGNVQSVYAIQTDNAIYTFKGSRIVQIQSMDKAFLFRYNNTNNQYTVSIASPNSTYQIPTTYEKPNITFPTFPFELPTNQSIPNYFTGIMVTLKSKLSDRSIDDATLQMNYFDSEHGNKSLIMMNVGGGRYYASLTTNDTTMDQYFDRNKLLQSIIQQNNVSVQLIQAYPISDICSKAPNSAKSFCILITQEMSSTIPDTLRMTSDHISQARFQTGPVGQLSNFEVIQFIPGEEPETVSLNSNDSPGPTRLSSLIAINSVIDPNILNTFDIQSSGLKGQCNEQTVAGSDTPDDRIIDIGKARTTVRFLYDTYIIKDQIDVSYMNRQVFSTGCIGANGEVSISLDDNESTIRVSVTPDCAGETDTAWYYTIQCPGELICDDDICYCRLSRNPSHQKKPSTFNGCGAEDSSFNWLTNSIGDRWQFTPACNDHDLCYGGCNNRKTSCDSNLLNGMIAACKTGTNFLLIPDCVKYADIFYGFVHFLGHGPFTSAQREDCDCVSN